MSSKTTRNITRLFSFLLATILVISLIPAVESDAGAYASAYALPKLTGDQAQDIVNIAISQLGYSEASDGGTVYGAWWTKVTSGYNYTYSGWCAMFACWCANQAGAGMNISYDKNSAKVSNFVSYLKKNGKVETSFGSKPKPGDFIFFGNGGSADHVAIVTEYDSKTNVVTFVGGNQSNKVKKSTVTWSKKGLYGKQYVLGYARPNYTKVEKTAAPKVTTDKLTYYMGENAVISWGAVTGSTGYAVTILKEGKTLTEKDLGTATTYTLKDAAVGKYTVKVTSSNGYVPSDAGVCEFVVSDVKPSVHLWLSDVQQGAELDAFKVGENYYLCYELYDELSGKKIDSIKEYEYSVKLAVLDAEGQSRLAETYTKDTGNGSFYFNMAGSYTVQVDVSGAFKYSQKMSVEAGENPKKLHISQDSVVLSLNGDASSAMVYVWTSGYYDGAASLLWQRSNISASCAWGDKTKDGRYPLILTANSAGTTEITLASKVSGSDAILDIITLTVTVDATSYSVSYDANGGEGAPEAQVKTHGQNLTLQTDKPERKGYIFLGWATAPDATVAEYQPGTVFLTDATTTLYAVWSATFLSGDTNEDGTVNLKDWNCLYEHNNEVSALTGEALLLADVNGDGKVNMKDWTRLYEHVCEINPLW